MRPAASPCRLLRWQLILGHGRDALQTLKVGGNLVLAAATSDTSWSYRPVA